MIDIKKVVEVELSDMIDNNIEIFLRILSEKATGHDYLMTVDYRIIGHVGDTVLKLEVTGEYEDEDIDEDIDEDDAVMTPSGNLGSKTSLSIDGRFIGEFEDTDGAVAAFKEWTEEHNSFPTLWWVDDHGGKTIF